MSGSAGVRKRAMDVIVGGTLAIAAAPVIVVLALASAVTFRAWPFFIQDRIGIGGERFRFPKIRSLSTDTPSELDLPWLSRFIRDHHLDELPQLYLVPLSRMSLVGPRPKMPDDYEPVEERYAALRTLVPQGCTCLWQVGMDTHGLPSDSPEYDFWYLAHGSIRLDTWILWRTGLTVLGVGSPVSLADIPEWARRGGLDQRGPHSGTHRSPGQITSQQRTPLARSRRRLNLAGPPRIPVVSDREHGMLERDPENSMRLADREWHKRRRNHLRPSTHRGYRKCIDHWIMPNRVWPTAWSPDPLRRMSAGPTEHRSSKSPMEGL